MRNFVELFYESDRFQVFAAAKLIRQPLAFFAAVIEIEHRCDCIDSQSVQVKLAQPEQRVRDQKVANFIPAIVKDVSAPIGMLAPSGIEMFVERRAVEARQGERVFGKMRRYP